MQSAIRAAADPLLHRPGDRPARVLQSAAAAAAERGATRHRRRCRRTRCRRARGTRRSSTIPTRTLVHVLGLVERLSAVRHRARSRPGASSTRASRRRCFGSTPSSTAGSASARTTATPSRPYIEGAWMTKHGGRYYLQYGAPGTEYNVYANGTYVGDDPLGPFTYAPYNPVSYKPGGFMTGAGHGNTFQDNHGNWWNTGTPWLGDQLELRAAHRRCSRPASTPTARCSPTPASATSRTTCRPESGRDRNELFTGWMLLSYRKPATRILDPRQLPRRARHRRESAHLLGRGQQPAGRVADDRPRRRVRGEGGAGELRRLRVGHLRERLDRLHPVPAAALDRRQALADDRGPRRRAPRPAERLHRAASRRCGRASSATSTSTSPRPTSRSATSACSATRGGRPPATPARPRRAPDTDAAQRVHHLEAGAAARSATTSSGASGRTSCTRPTRSSPIAEPTLELRALTVGQDYWVAIEAFDEIGVSRMSEPERMR